MSHRRRRQHGQVLVILAISLTVLLIAAGLVIDGGWALAQQRRTQNAMDAAANAGAVVLVQNLPYRTRGEAEPRTDASVLAEIVSVAAGNGVTDDVPTAVYTDIDGLPLDPEVVVGSLGAAPPPADAYGVEVQGSIPFGTFFSSIAGFTGFRASARATAVAGAVTSTCAADQPCTFLPVTFPTQLTTCDGTGRQALGGTAYPVTTAPIAGNELIIPLCGTASGSVGWLDLEPPNPVCNGNGAAELACVIGNPPAESLPLPVWVATQTGNVNSELVQDALDEYSGNIVGTYEPGLDLTVQIPIYDCIDNNVVQPSSSRPCPTTEPNGVGANTSYHIVGIMAFILDRSYIQQNNPECNASPGSPFVGGNGSNGCLKGWLTQVSTAGPVGMPTGSVNSVWGVQLVR